MLGEKNNSRSAADGTLELTDFGECEEIIPAAESGEEIISEAESVSADTPQEPPLPILLEL